MANLNMAEELLLLALKEEKGTIPITVSSYLVYGLIGSCLMELTLGNRLGLEQNKLVVTDDSPTGEPSCDVILTKISQARHPHKADYWVSALSWSQRKLRRDLCEQLANRGMLREETSQICFFTRRRYFVNDSLLKSEIIAKLRRYLFEETNPDFRLMGLLGLCEACDLLNFIFEGDERKQVKEKIKLFTKTELEGTVIGAIKRGVSNTIRAAKSARH